MKVLSLQQPYATAVMQGLTHLECRGTPLRYRGPLLIHAATIRATTRRCRAYPGLTPDTLPYGAILGVVEAVGCIPDHDGCGYEWFFANPRPLPKPVPCTGVGNLWESPPDLILPEDSRATATDRNTTPASFPTPPCARLAGR